jgi:calcineurin-like phosphoesterase
VIRLLFVGDVMGEPGRRALKSQIEPLIDRERVDFVVANAENAAGGHGLTARVLDELLELPVDVWTSATTRTAARSGCWTPPPTC